MWKRTIGPTVCNSSGNLIPSTELFGPASCTDFTSEMLPQIGESLDDQQPIGLHDLLMLEMPRVRMRNQDRAESSFNRGIDVRFGRIADHPAAVFIEFVITHDAPVTVRILFAGDHGAPKKTCEPGCVDLPPLLFEVAFRE